MTKRITAIVLAALLMITIIPSLAFAVNVSLNMSADFASLGDDITASGLADPDKWVSIKILDNTPQVILYDAVKSDVYGNYTYSFIVPATASEVLSVVSGYGSNVAVKELCIGIPSQNVSLNLDKSRVMPGAHLNASGSADPGSWIQIKMLDSKGGMVFSDYVKADASGNYTMMMEIPEGVSGELDVVAGYGLKVVTNKVNVSNEVDACFIATAAFGSKYDPPVALLRAFRDEFLLSNGPGSDFVEFYYHHSPPLANYIAGNDFLKAGVRVLLAPVIVLVYLLFHPFAMGAGVAAIVFGIVIFRLKKRPLLSD